MVSDLAFPIEIVGVETAREESGLAMSSRNGYLTKAQLKKAPKLREILLELAEKLSNSKGNLQKASTAQQKMLPSLRLLFSNLL